MTTENHLKTGGEKLHDKNRLSGSALVVSAACIKVYKELKIRRKCRYCIFKVGENEIEVDTTSARDATLNDFKNILPMADCRYGIYDHEFKTNDGRLQSKLYFIVWMPKNSTPHTKMAYATGKSKFNQSMEGLQDVQVETLDEIDNLMGIQVEEEDHEFGEDDF